MPRHSAASTHGTADGSHAADDTSARRARGIALIAGALVIVALIETKTIPEQQMVQPFAGQTWVYAALLAAWGAYELRPASRR